jgi:predicted MFS family arabinose efflux permease
VLFLQSIFPSIQQFFNRFKLPTLLDRLIAKIKVPESGWKRFLFCFLEQLISFAIIATNFRALAKGLLVWTVCTDGLIVLQNTIVAKLFNENEKMRDGLSIVAFTLGGMCGSAICILLTRYIWGS